MTTAVAHLACSSCGSGFDVGLRLTFKPSTRTATAAVHVRLDPVDLAWLRAFSEAHRGPIQPTAQEAA